MSNENQDYKIDEFFKNSYDQDMIIPSGLEWENMDIQIPKKKRRLGFLIFSLLGALVVSGVLLLIGQQKQVIGNSIHQDVVSLSRTSNSDDDLIEMTQVDRNRPKKSLAIERNPVLSGDTNTPKPDVVVPRNNSNMFVDPANSEMKINHYTSANTKPKDMASKGLLSWVKESRKEEQTLDDLLTQSSVNEENTAPIEKLEVQPLLINSSDLEPFIEQSNSVPSKYTLALFVGSGISNYRIDSRNITNENVKSIPSLAVSIQVQKRIRKNWVATVDLLYSRDHSTFDYTRESGRVIDAARKVEIITCEHTHHNNYAHAIQAQLGFGYNIALNSKLFLQPQLSISAGMNLRVSGKAWDDNDIVLLKDSGNLKSTSLGVESALLIRHNLTSSISLLGKAAYTSNFIATQEINIGVYSINRLKLSFGVGYDF